MSSCSNRSEKRLMLRLTWLIGGPHSIIPPERGRERCRGQRKKRKTSSEIIHRSEFNVPLQHLRQKRCATGDHCLCSCGREERPTAFLRATIPPGPLKQPEYSVPSGAWSGERSVVEGGVAERHDDVDCG